MMEWTYQELGLSNPFVVDSGVFKEKNTIPNPAWKKMMKEAGVSAVGGMGGYGAGEGGMTGMMGPGMGAGMGPGMGPGGAAPTNPKIDPNVKRVFEAPKFLFKLQVIWKEKPLTARLEARRLAEEAAAAAAAEEGGEMGSEVEGEVGTEPVGDTAEISADPQP
jgi:hypothetical protein